ncbi:MAG: VWA domain-containing protein [Bacteroidales bacterium]|nr:VWA domain-containing protein [Bacteroidales bacterium]
MFRFAEPVFFYGLLMIPVFIIIFWIMMSWKRKAMKRFGESKLISQLIPDASKSKPQIKFILLLFAFVLIILGLANPQIGSKLETVERKGIDIVIAIDVSNSMLAEDIKPNRIQRARQAISKLVDELKNDRIGIVVFAGNAYTQLPITTDYSAAKLFLSTINTDIVPTQGTAIAEAIELSMDAFGENDHNKAIIIITDGEDHEGDAIVAAKKAVEKGIKIYTIGMGLPEGAPIPVYDRYGNQQGFKKDLSNNTVITRLNESMLQQIAAAGEGEYVRANNTQAGLGFIFNEINKLEKTEFESRVFSDYEDRFQYLLAAALALLLLEFIIFERRGKRFRNVNLFGSKKTNIKTES